MSKWKLLHLVSGKVSIWMLRQLRNHIRFLSDQLFSQIIAVDNPKTAKFVEQYLLTSVYSIGRRFSADVFSFYHISKLVEKISPDVIICWQIDWIDLLRFSLSGTRKRHNIVIMVNRLYENGEKFASHFKSSEKNFNIHFVCSSINIADRIKGKIQKVGNLDVVYPGVEMNSAVDARALRNYFSFDEDANLVYIPPEANLEGILAVVHGLSIVHRLHSNIRIVLPYYNDELIDKVRCFINRATFANILRFVDYSQSELALSCCNMIVVPSIGYLELISAYSAMSYNVPVIMVSFRGRDDILVANETFVPVARTIPRVIASAAHKLILNDELKDKLISRASERVKSYCSKTSYTDSLVKLYKQIIEGTGKPK